MNPSTGLVPQKITGFNGLWKRGSEETCPPDHLTDCMNCIFPGKSQVSIREAVTISSSNLLASTVVSYAIARVPSAAVLLTLSSAGLLYDETNTFLLGTFTGADDFVCLNIFGRSYIALKQNGKAWGLNGTCSTTTAVAGSTSNVSMTAGTIPFSAIGCGIIINGIQCNITTYTNSTTFQVDYDFGTLSGLATQFSAVFYYTGNGTLYPIAGTRPLNSTGSPAWTAASWGSGYNTPGTHQFFFCYQYTNGNLSPPNQAPWNTIVNATGTGYTFTFHDTPPAGVVARVLLSTLYISGASPAATVNAPTFFIPNGTIPVANTTPNVSYYDTDLLTSSDYLFNISESVLGASALRFYNGRMVVIGQYPFPDNILVSDELICEQFNSVSGIINMPVDYGLNTSSSGLILGDVLYILKPNSTYSTQDNGGDPDTWTVSPIDTGLGAWDNGVTTYESSASAADVLNSSFILTMQGLMLFNGAYQSPPLTYKIESLWQLVTPPDLHLCQIAHDVFLKRVYLLVPLGLPVSLGDQFFVPSNTNNNIILMMDYQEGITPTAVKWSVWFFKGFQHQTGDLFPATLSGQFIKKIKVENFTLNYGSAIPIYQFTFAIADTCIYATPTPAALVSAPPVSGYPVSWGLCDVFLNSGTLYYYQVAQYIITAPVKFSDAAISCFTMLQFILDGQGMVAYGIFPRNRAIGVPGFSNLVGAVLNMTPIKSTNLTNYYYYPNSAQGLTPPGPYYIQRGLTFECESMQIVIMAGYTMNTTSASAVTVGVGSQTFIVPVPSSGTSYPIGAVVYITSPGTTAIMIGVITSYSTPNLVVTISTSTGSGTLSNWNIEITGPATTLWTQPFFRCVEIDVFGKGKYNMRPQLLEAD
jgi:hypothetical protein